MLLIVSNLSVDVRLVWTEFDQTPALVRTYQINRVAQCRSYIVTFIIIMIFTHKRNILTKNHKGELSQSLTY